MNYAVMIANVIAMNAVSENAAMERTGSSMHPAVAKAKFIGKIAAEHDWKGSLDSNVVDTERVTSITGRRNGEAFFMYWTNEKLTRAGYSITVDDEIKEFKITHSKAMIAKLTDWPDVIKLYEWFPKANRPLLTQRYRRLPFDLESDSNEEIIEKLRGAKLFWYGHETTKIHDDIVLPKKNKQIRIVDVGHRKLFHFIGQQAGFRSVLLDTVLKVA